MSDLASAFRMQALGCARFGSLFYEALLNRAAEDIEARGPTLSLMSPWANATRKEVFADASHLRLMGGLLRTVRYMEIEPLDEGRASVFSHGEMFEGPAAMFMPKALRKRIKAGFIAMSEALQAEAHRRAGR